MRYWLMKSEPSDWSWDDQVARGRDGEDWTGVRNYQARNMMHEMRTGDLAFFYHSQTDRACVGIVRVIAEAHPDPTAEGGAWDCVTVEAVEPLPQPVPLDQIKAEPALSEMVLVRNSRLSVQPVTAEEWRIVRRMAGLD